MHDTCNGKTKGISVPRLRKGSHRVSSSGFSAGYKRERERERERGGGRDRVIRADSSSCVSRSARVMNKFGDRDRVICEGSSIYRVNGAEKSRHPEERSQISERLGGRWPCQGGASK